VHLLVSGLKLLQKTSKSGAYLTRNIPQRLKPGLNLIDVIGTSKLVPFQDRSYGIFFATKGGCSLMDTVFRHD
jgi:hypothetical protein